MPDIEWIVLYMALGAIAGFMAGLLGLGGGGILVPLLASIFTMQGMSADNVVHLALGTSLACMIISSTASIRAHAFRGAIMWRVASGMAPGIVIGAFLAAHAATNLNSIFIAVFFTLFMGVTLLAKLLGIAPETVLNWELNYRKPSINHIGKLIEFLGYDPALPNPRSIAELLLAKRRELSWMQKVAAKNFGVDPCTWPGWECGGVIMMREHR